MGFDVRQHARAESISKRAPSTTRTSLRLESTTCEQSCDQIIAKTSFKSYSAPMRFVFNGLRAGENQPPLELFRRANVLDRLTGMRSRTLTRYLPGSAQQKRARARSNNIASAAPVITSSSNMPALHMNWYSRSVATCAADPTRQSGRGEVRLQFLDCEDALISSVNSGISPSSPSSIRGPEVVQKLLADQIPERSVRSPGVANVTRGVTHCSIQMSEYSSIPFRLRDSSSRSGSCARASRRLIERKVPGSRSMIRAPRAS